MVKPQSHTNCKKLGTDIFSCDSRQFFEEMSIALLFQLLPNERVPHHFIQHKSMLTSYSVGQFESDAIESLSDYFKQNDIAILVGGSGLYMHAVVHGIDQFPTVSEEIHSSLGKRLETNGLEDLQKELQTLDPEHFENMDIKNPSRVLRALIVCLVANKPYSSFLNQKKPPRPFKVYPLTVDIPRTLLYNLINDRVDQMMNAGLLLEAERLYHIEILMLYKLLDIKRYLILMKILILSKPSLKSNKHKALCKTPNDVDSEKKPTRKNQL